MTIFSYFNGFLCNFFLSNYNNIGVIFSIYFCLYINIYVCVCELYILLTLEGKVLIKD